MTHQKEKNKYSQNGITDMENIKLKITDLTKTYGKRSDIPALDHVSFDVYEGEFLSILGPSGCGKTTLLRILIGLCEATEGSVVLDGTDITNMHPSKRSMGIVFQNYALFENMTVKQNITYAANIKAKKDKTASSDEISQRADKMMEMLGISEHANKYPSALSGGQMQRVAIARTLIHNPKIMLFDEPMSALDVATRLQLRDLIKQIQHDFGTTMIYITHDQEEAFAMSDRIIVMDHAKIVQIDTPKNIIKHPSCDYVKSFVVDNLKKKIFSLEQFISCEEGSDNA